MECFECETGNSREVVGFCRHCSVALCREHSFAVEETLCMTEPIAQTVALPKRARLLLCRTCKTALEQGGVTSVLAGTTR